MDSHFQILVLGTGLTESITAAALSKAGLKVLQVDTNPYYGGNEASLTTEELKNWVEEIKTSPGDKPEFSTTSIAGESPPSSRSYSLSLSPSLIVSSGPLISSLINSGVARYSGFKLVEHISVYSAAGFKSVPASKEDIFKSKELSLLDKRRLMRFLVFASGEYERASEVRDRESMPFSGFLEDVFSLSAQLASTLAYALAFCKNNADTVMSALARIKRYLRSAGRYGPSPFLVGQYGGLGELSQGFCRVCAVSGGTYILGQDIVSLDVSAGQTAEGQSSDVHCLNLSNVSEEMTADVIITSSSLLSKLKKIKDADIEDGSTRELQVYCVTVVDGSIASLTTPESSMCTEEVADEAQETRSIDSALLVFPPGELSFGTAHGPVNVLINGEGTLSCPRGKSILYISTILDDSASEELGADPEHLLRPYLNATLSLTRASGSSPLRELFSTFYARSYRSFTSSFLESLKERGILVCPNLPAHFAETGDAAATNAEALFRDVLKRMGKDCAEVEFWPPLPGEPDDEDIL